MKLRLFFQYCLVSIGFWLGSALPAPIAHADEPISVQLLASRGEHYQALVAFEKLPKRKVTSESIIAAARSAWALSLHEQAASLFDRALESPNLSEIDRGRIYLSRGIIELQQQQYQMAVLFGAKALEHVSEAGPLRAKIKLLIGNAKLELREYGPAYESLIAALGESNGDDEGELHYLIGSAALQLNRVDEAETNFKAVPYGHDRTASAIRKLAEVNLTLNHPEKTVFWIEKGKHDYPDQFIDSWVPYALAQAAIARSDYTALRAVQAEANQKYAPSDFWVGLINATTETALWKQREGVAS